MEYILRNQGAHLWHLYSRLDWVSEHVLLFYNNRTISMPEFQCRSQKLISYSFASVKEVASKTLAYFVANLEVKKDRCSIITLRST